MIKALIHSALRKFGKMLVPYREAPPFPPDFDDEIIDIIRMVRPYTMTSPEILFALRQAVQYVAFLSMRSALHRAGRLRRVTMCAYES